MTLQEQIKADLKTAMKQRDDSRKDALRIIMGEWSRSEKKEFTDDEVFSIIKKLIKSEKETLERAGETDSEYLSIMESYLPQMVSEDEIRAWIQGNINFDDYKNKMQAMGGIMKHFGSSADGNIVKRILQSL
ncbi:MAG: GatB/YqeY domain-containing protein [Desulfobacteraceae bacterium]|nr:GatB/YqeY domain-containing protein [Desulfobacteraceae bacterium]